MTCSFIEPADYDTINSNLPKTSNYSIIGSYKPEDHNLTLSQIRKRFNYFIIYNVTKINGNITEIDTNSEFSSFAQRFPFGKKNIELEVINFFNLGDDNPKNKIFNKIIDLKEYYSGEKNFTFFLNLTNFENDENYFAGNRFYFEIGIRDNFRGYYNNYSRIFLDFIDRNPKSIFNFEILILCFIIPLSIFLISILVILFLLCYYCKKWKKKNEMKYKTNFSKFNDNNKKIELKDNNDKKIINNNDNENEKS